MAQQFIKIFDDTVLKQSVNQGYEVQRTNSRLGQFTIGELAYTRDTARLFVGNFSTQDRDLDSSFVTGGNIVGNKYLGLIDSKRLTHFRTTSEGIKQSTAIPLNYEMDTISVSAETDENGFYKTYVERAILLKNSKFRTDKNNCWSKGTSYNEKYDAYNGDYIFDIYNNAVILFDNTIKVQPSTEPKNWIVDENTNEQKFISPDGNYYIEGGDGGNEGGKASYSTRRTRIQNAAESPDSTIEYNGLGDPTHPVYGDGYVIMRIIEPDNISLGYKAKEFSQSDGTPVDGNYSHNYIEIKNIPIDKLSKCLDPDVFITTTNTYGAKYISFSGVMETIRVANIQLKDEDTETLSMPNDITFTNYEENDENKIRLTFSQGIGTDTSDRRILCLSPKNAALTHFEAYPVQPCTLKIVTNDAQGEGVLVPGKEVIIDITKPLGETVTFYNVSDPFFTIPTDETGLAMNQMELNYTGSSIYNKGGGTISFEEVPYVHTEDICEDVAYQKFFWYDSAGTSAYHRLTSEDYGEGIETQFMANGYEHPYIATGYNLLREAKPMAWGKSSASSSITGWAQFFINPFLVSPYTYCGGTIRTLGHDDPIIDNRKLSALGGHKNEARPWNIQTINEYGEEMENYKGNTAITHGFDPTTYDGVPIPDHAQSLVCELHVIPLSTTASCSVMTSCDYTKFNESDTIDATTTNNFQLFDETSVGATQPQIITSAAKLSHAKLACQLKCYSTTDYKCQQFELPFYRNADQMKFCNLCVSAKECAYVVRAIGYRA